MLHEQRGRSSYVTLNLVVLVVVCFVCFVAGLAFMSFADSKASPTCAICEKALPILSHSGVHEACLQARIVQYANELDPMAGMAGMETDGDEDAGR